MEEPPVGRGDRTNQNSEQTREEISGVPESAWRSPDLGAGSTWHHLIRPRRDLKRLLHRSASKSELGEAESGQRFGRSAPRHAQEGLWDTHLAGRRSL